MTATGRRDVWSRWKWELVLPAAIAIAGGLAAARLLWEAGRAVALLILAGALAAALAPLVTRLARHMNRGLAVLLVYLGLTVVLFSLGWFTVPTLSQQVEEIGNRAPELMSTIQQRLASVLPDTAQPRQVIDRLVQPVVQWGQQVPGLIVSFAGALLVVVFLSLYLLIASRQLHQLLVSLFPPVQHRRVSMLLCRIATAMGGYFRGVAIDAAVIGLLTWAALSVIGVPFTLPLAVLAAAGEFVPYIGPVIAAVPAVAAGLLQSTQQGLIVALTYVAIQQIEGHIVTPLVMRSQTDVHPATVIVALTTGYTVGGLLGALAAIPIFAAGRVLLRHVIAPAVRARSRHRPH